MWACVCAFVPSGLALLDGATRRMLLRSSPLWGGWGWFPSLGVALQVSLVGGALQARSPSLGGWWALLFGCALQVSLLGGALQALACLLLCVVFVSYFRYARVFGLELLPVGCACGVVLVGVCPRFGLPGGAVPLSDSTSRPVGAGCAKKK